MRLIDADAAIEAINKREKLMVGDKCVGIDHIRTFINNRPTIDCEPVRHAYWVPWIEDVEIYNTGGFVEQKQVGWKCSGCKGGRVSWKRTYCPDCGAKMDGGKENDT